MKLESQKDMCNIKDRIIVPEVSGKNIYDINVKPSIINQSVFNNQIVLEGEIELEIMFEEDATLPLDIKIVKMPFNFRIDNKNIQTNTMFNISLEIATQDFIVGIDGNIDVQVDLMFYTNISKNVTLSTIDEVNMEEGQKELGHSMTIYFAKKGDTLWKIAKEFGSTVEEIARINDIGNPDVLQIGRQLYIPKYKVCKKKLIA